MDTLKVVKMVLVLGQEEVGVLIERKINALSKAEVGVLGHMEVIALGDGLLDKDEGGVLGQGKVIVLGLVFLPIVRLLILCEGLNVVLNH